MGALKKQLPLVLVFVTALIPILGRYVAVGPFPSLLTGTAKWFQTASNFAWLLGAINLSIVYVSQVRKKRTNWMFSLYALVVMWGYSALGIIQTNQGVAYRWLFNAFYNPMVATMYSILAFYIVSAAFRSFRVRTVEATVLMGCAVLAMLGRVPVGKIIWSQIPDISQWFLNVPNTGAMRGILLGVYLGGYATMIRIIMGLERAYLGER